jgi:hypothetical protein
VFRREGEAEAEAEVVERRKLEGQERKGKEQRKPLRN